MLAPDTTQTFTIVPRAPVMLEYAIGARLTVLRGEVWITQYGDSRDIILTLGQTFEVERPACLVMTSIGAEEGGAEVELRRPDLAATRTVAPLPAWRRWLPLRWSSGTQPLMGIRLRRLRMG